MDLRDSIYSEELTQNLMAVQAEYEQRENKAKIESQNNLLVLKEEIIGKQQWLNILAVATVLLLVAFVITLFRNNQQKKKTNQLLELKVQERTKELSQSYQLIEKAYADQTHLIVKASSDIKSPLSTMKGLCSLALQEIEDPSAKQYMIQMDATTTHLSEMVNKLSVR